MLTILIHTFFIIVYNLSNLIASLKILTLFLYKCYLDIKYSLNSTRFMVNLNSFSLFKYYHTQSLMFEMWFLICVFK